MMLWVKTNSQRSRHRNRKLLARTLVTESLDSRLKIGAYTGPLLQNHGDADTVVPYELGRRLFDAANEPKRFVRISGGDHNDAPTPEYLVALERFLKALTSPSTVPGRPAGNLPKE
jgi:fermentation-respiration switch protein FrsA (DUF1100 family)